MNRYFLIAVLGLMPSLGFSPIKAADGEFVKVLNGTDLTGLKIEPGKASDIFKVEDGILKVSGRPNGYFYTDKSYKNFVLRFEWRYPDKAGNSGLLVYIQPPSKVFPKCIEVQGAYGSHGQIFALGGAKGKFTDDGAARRLEPDPRSPAVRRWRVSSASFYEAFDLREPSARRCSAACWLFSHVYQAQRLSPLRTVGAFLNNCQGWIDMRAVQAPGSSVASGRSYLRSPNSWLSTCSPLCCELMEVRLGVPSLAAPATKKPACSLHIVTT